MNDQFDDPGQDESSWEQDARQSRARRRTGTVIGVVCVLVAAGGYAVSHYTRDVQIAPPQMIGSVWTATGENPRRLYFVTEEERGERRYYDVDLTQSYTLRYSVYELQARDARTGAPAGAAKIARIENAPTGQGPEILGAQSGILWLWNGGLEGRKLGTLEPVWTSAKIAETNPEFAAALPTEPKYCKLLGKPGVLVFKGREARYLRIDADSGKISVLDEALLRNAASAPSADTAFRELRSEGKAAWTTSPGGLMWNSLTHDGKWFALLSGDERAGLRRSSGDPVPPTGESSRQLFSASFEMENRPLLGKDIIALDLATVAPVSDDRYLMSGFLRRPATGGIWTADNGESAFVLHRRALGADSPWQITRLGLDGKPRWTRATGVADLQFLCDGGGTIVLTGFSDFSQPTRNRSDLFVFVEEATGALRTLNLVHNTVTDAQ